MDLSLSHHHTQTHWYHRTMLREWILPRTWRKKPFFHDLTHVLFSQCTCCALSITTLELLQQDLIVIAKDWHLDLYILVDLRFSVRKRPDIFPTMILLVPAIYLLDWKKWHGLNSLKSISLWPVNLSMLSWNLFCTRTPHNFLSKPLTAFPHSHRRNNSKWKMTSE